MHALRDVLGMLILLSGVLALIVIALRNDYRQRKDRVAIRPILPIEESSEVVGDVVNLPESAVIAKWPKRVEI